MRPNKTELIQKIKQLEGITSEERSYLIDLVNTKKKYGLVWEDKPEEAEELLKSKLPVLREVVERRILSESGITGLQDLQDKKAVSIDATLFPEFVNQSNHINHPNHSSDIVAPNHILIEGDNLHALTALSFTHEGKIDVIYIDPPYNTGQENEFRYNDRWILKEDPFKHSTWLNFISKRIRIAKRLLHEKGVIIIHIDENEFDTLNLFLETEIFSEETFLGAVVWNKQNPKGDAKGVANMHEYLLIYAKNKSDFNSMGNALMRAKPNALKILKKAKRLFSKLGKIDIPEDIKEVIKPFNFGKIILEDFKVKYDLLLVNKEFQSWLSRQDFSGGEKAYKMIDERGKVYQSVSMAWPNKEQASEDYFQPLIHPITKMKCPMPARGWRNPPQTMQILLDNNLILFGEDENTQPRRKYLLEENMFENTPSIYNNGSSDDDLFKELKINFPYPKPVEVAAYFLKCIHPNPSTILDFFAGSGTTLHATMQLNAEDGGNRQCILVTNNENNICEEVTYERNRRVIQGYTNSKGEWVKGLANNNLRYYKTEFVPSVKDETNKRLLTEAGTDLLCIKEDCYTDLTESAGFNPAQCKIFTNDRGKYLMVIFHIRKPMEVYSLLSGYIQSLENLSEPVKLYGFSPEKETLAEDFAFVAERIEAIPLPEAIYNAYRSVFKTLKLDRSVEKIHEFSLREMSDPNQTPE